MQVDTRPWRVQLPPFSGGRIHTEQRRVRISDVDGSGRTRFDSLARYLQDVATDDVRDAGVEDAVAWVVRRTTILAERKPVLGEDLSLATWCSGTGTALAERRTTITGSRGSLVEAVALWVSLDPRTMRPVPLEDSHFAPYRRAAGDRRVRSRFVLPADPGDAAVSRPWPLRSGDFDVYGHMNNVVSWTAAEEEARRVDGAARYRWGQVEYRLPIDPSPTVEVVSEAGPEMMSVWLLAAEGSPASSARLGGSEAATEAPGGTGPYQ